MGISMSYDYIHKPATPGMVQELLREIEEDEAQFDSITESYRRVGLSPEKDPVYWELADRIRDNFYQAGDLYSKLPQDSDDLDIGEMKSQREYSGAAIKSQDPEFIDWANDQMKLAGMRE